MSSTDAFEPGQHHEAQATSFGSAADVYERGRPGYPAEAVDWLLPAGAQNVVDLGAGTGKLTRLLVERVPDVTAIEPSAGMREQLIRNVPGVQVLPGSAERLPIDGATADAVLAAQAWHWVDPERAVPEVARVLKPGGVLGLLWNIREGAAPWLDALESIMSAASAATESDMASESPQVGDPFGPIERRDFRWTFEMTPETVEAMVASRSYVITLSPSDREAMLGEVRDLLRTHPDTAGRATVGMPYVTRCSRAILPA
ncbi:putative methyltransferase [Frondihabitans sucicola]|uniref:Methyltransferase n=1 Tax=Frondihabitans sucicola TaxID=1268041 RepID=A0ABM8GMS4_9MICO|nr:class I SAM-dependent methyltransferase [Frondihabitans sucicola]BDZ49510.1 putative methyltransferase [Frondihabitans sucicola]